MKKVIFIIAWAATVAACHNTGNQKTTSESETPEQSAEILSSPSELYEKEWKLSELNGRAIVLDSTFQRYPHLVFGKENTLSGNLGCNGFGGKIEFEADNTIKISDLAATQLACANLEVEQGFLDALKNAQSYTVQNNVLTLSNDKNEITAKLEVTAR